LKGPETLPPDEPPPSFWPKNCKAFHYHVVITDGVFSAVQDGHAEFHPALDLDDDCLSVQQKMRKRGLRWLSRIILASLVTVAQPGTTPLTGNKVAVNF